jgi:hypothetical protein
MREYYTIDAALDNSEGTTLSEDGFQIEMKSCLR